MTPLLHHAEFRGAASALFADRSGEVVLSGPAGTGKSRAALTKVHLAMLKYPGARALIVRRTARSLGSTTLVTFTEKVAQQAFESRTVHFYGGSQQEAGSYRYDNGSRITVGGMDNPDKMLSSDYDLIFADECTELSETAWNTLVTRLRNNRMPYQQLIGCCNPGPPTHWLRTRERLRMLHTAHADNPAYHDGTDWTPQGRAYLDQLDTLTGVQRKRLLSGVWAASEGVVYDGFDPAVHIVEPFDIPAHWPRTLAVDFGYTHAFAALWLARDDDGRLYVYRELLHTGRLVEDHAAQMLRIRQPGEPWPRSIVCDHQAEDRATLERHLGAGTRPAKKTVSDGIQAVASRLKPAGDGRPRLLFMRGALVERDPALAEAGKPTCITEEIGGYVWNDHKNKDEPVKENDDLLDCARYGIAEHDLKPRPRVRFM